MRNDILILSPNGYSIVMNEILFDTIDNTGVVGMWVWGQIFLKRDIV